MLLRSFREVSWCEKDGDESRGFRVRSLFSQEQGARKLALRLFELSPGGELPYHAYVWEQELFVLDGTGTVRSPEEELAIAPGDAILIQAGEPHQLTAGDDGMRLLCATPILTNETDQDAGRLTQSSSSSAQRFASGEDASDLPPPR